MSERDQLDRIKLWRKVAFDPKASASPMRVAERNVDWLIGEVERLREELEVLRGGYEGAQETEVEARTLLIDIRTQLYHFFDDASIPGKDEKN